MAPEQIEHVIGTIPGVLENVVCPTEGGPTAAVVLLPGSNVSKEDIHHAVNCESLKIVCEIETLTSLLLAVFLVRIKLLTMANSVNRIS